jgi:phage baseplate assembly protein V
MPDGLLEFATRALSGDEDRVDGVAVAIVLDNVDMTGEARVQVQLPWLPGIEPWARVAVPVAGPSRGFYILPQVGDEVLVAFEHGDVKAPYVVGSLWNGRDKPPTTEPNDAESKVILQTEQGHVIQLDDLEQSLTITTPSGQKITADQQKIELEAGSAKATLETSGQIKLEAETEIELKASSIKLNGTTVDVKASSSLSLQGSASCTVQGGVVKIN